MALRYGNVYGPRQNPYGESGVVAIFTQQMLQNKIPIIHGNGQQTKDYIFVNDAIEATILCLKKDFRGVINIGTSKEVSVITLFSELKQIIGFSKDPRHIVSPIKEFSARVSLSNEKAKKQLDWRPQYTLKQGLKETVDWFQDV